MHLMLAGTLVAASSAIMVVLGVVHLILTFRGPKLTPRDVAVQSSMSTTSPVLTRETTMWKAWIGFNASHSLGAILFGLVYGYFALVHPDLFFRSIFLIALGFAVLTSYAVLGKVYWFRVPFRAIVGALAAYTAAVFVVLGAYL